MHLVSTIDGPAITFSRSETIETILIAEDWQEGWEKSLRKEDYSKSGYIGRGTSKRVIYVCFYHEHLECLLMNLGRLGLEMWSTR
jgi:hypothetical protein